MAMRLYVSYIPCATSLREQTGDIITFTHFEEGNLLFENCDDEESGDKYDDDLIMPPLISEEEMDTMDSGDESDDKPILQRYYKTLMAVVSIIQE